jgi:nucleotide-binding universal stress UspA family protein
MFKKILVPLDGSALAAKILPHVVDLAKTHQAQVTLLYVYYPQVGEATPGVIQEAVAQEAKRCELFLAEAAKDLKAQGVAADFACVEGQPAREIIGYAAKNGFDLIALATHGKGEVAWVLGSVAEKVVSHATVPVLLYRVIAIKPPVSKEEFEELMLRGVP